MQRVTMVAVLMMLASLSWGCTSPVGEGVSTVPLSLTGTIYLGAIPVQDVLVVARYDAQCDFLDSILSGGDCTKRTASHTESDGTFTLGSPGPPLSGASNWCGSVVEIFAPASLSTSTGPGRVVLSRDNATNGDCQSGIHHISYDGAPAIEWADEFVLIPAGSFPMGSTTGELHEQPIHEVTIAGPFYLQTTEVTEAQWRSVMGTWSSTDCGDRCPVTGSWESDGTRFTWTDVDIFLERLNAANPGDHYRLPTEAEWEYAARAGARGDDRANIDPLDVGWYRLNSLGVLHPVGQKQANPWGLYDMHGNVWEMVSDWYSPTYYQSSPEVDPLGPLSGDYRVTRGGSVRDDLSDARWASRCAGGGDSASGACGIHMVGFRIVRVE